MTDYQREWREYKQLKSLYVRVLLLGWLAVLTVFVASGVLLHNGLPAFFVGILWILAGAYMQHKYFAFLCPRCGKKFDRRFRLRFFSLFARRCVHCGLPMYSS